jgi:hypothetical protein
MFGEPGAAGGMGAGAGAGGFGEGVGGSGGAGTTEPHVTPSLRSSEPYCVLRWQLGSPFTGRTCAERRVRLSESDHRAAWWSGEVNRGTKTVGFAIHTAAIQTHNTVAAAKGGGGRGVEEEQRTLGPNHSHAWQPAKVLQVAQQAAGSSSLVQLNALWVQLVLLYMCMVHWAPATATPSGS